VPLIAVVEPGSDRPGRAPAGPHTAEGTAKGEIDMRRTIAGALGSLALTATLGVAPAAAEDRVCRGELTDVTVDNLRVPDGATCTLTRVRVKGTAKAESDATLIINRSRVIGNVQGEDARKVIVRRATRVGGSVQFVQGGAARVINSNVNGDVQYDENDRRLAVNGNEVGGNVQVVQNTGGVVIRDNVIDGNLQCKANVPAPTGGNNTVGGNKEDQCEHL
jgi:hypothetical protein